MPLAQVQVSDGAAGVGQRLSNAANPPLAGERAVEGARHRQARCMSYRSTLFTRTRVAKRQVRLKPGQDR